MNDEQDPALSQEGDREAASDETVADPQATEGDAEAEGKPEDGAGASDNQEPAFSFEVEGETPPSKKEGAPQWVKDLRKKNRELEQNLAEFKSRQTSQAQPEQAEPGPRPALKDFEWDEDEHAKAVEAWTEKKNEAKRRKDAAEAQAAAQVAAVQQAWKPIADAHAAKAAEVAKSVPDYAEKEAVVTTILPDPLQQRLLMKYAKNSAELVVAIAQYPHLGEQLAKAGDVIEFVDAVRSLEARVKKTPNKNTPPPPERKIRGSGSGSGADSQLEKLREKARETGDFTPVIEYQEKHSRR